MEKYGRAESVAWVEDFERVVSDLGKDRSAIFVAELENFHSKNPSTCSYIVGKRRFFNCLDRAPRLR